MLNPSWLKASTALETSILGVLSSVNSGIGGGGSPVTWNDHVLALPNLWGWWKLDETAGAAVTATDSSGNGRHGTYNAAGTQAAGLFSGSSQCQATLGNRVSVPNWSVPTNAKFTVAAVIKTTHASGTEQQIFSADGGAGGRIFQFCKNLGTNVLSTVLIYPSVVSLNGTTAINDGNPHLAIFVYDESLAAAAGRMKLYLDGTLNAQSTTAITLSAGTADLGIGARRGSDNTGLWAGAIDEAFFCNGAISSTDVAALWAARNL